MKKYLFSFLGALLLTGIGISSGLGAEQDTKPTIAFAEPCSNANHQECALLESEGEAPLKFPRTVKQGEKFTVSLFITNPEQKNIVTVRSWLKYDSSVLKAVRLIEESSDFPLAAPDGNTLDAENGQVQIGRGVSGGGKKEARLLIASVEFEVISPQQRSTEISFVNFQKDVLGETGVFTLDQQTFQPVNILEKAPKTLELALNQSGGSTTPDQPISNDDPALPNSTNSGESNPASRLARPTGLRIEATVKSTNLTWELGTDKRIAGYFVYYSENSGFYIRRSDVGKTNHKQFSDLVKGKKYYFSITAYDAEGRESDYADEVFAIHGEPGSESHPFRFGTGNTKAPHTPQVDGLTENGPAETLAIALSLLGLFCVGFATWRLRLFS